MPPMNMPTLTEVRLWLSAKHNTTAPFVEASNELLQPVFQYFIDVIKKIQPDIRWLLTYALVVLAAYLFHSPFRAHSGSTMDGYGRLVRVFQMWLSVVVCIHASSHFLIIEQHRVTEKGERLQDTVSIALLPVAFVMSAILAFLHKMKRRWKLGVTYGPNFSLVLLNSMSLGIIATAYYALSSRFTMLYGGRFGGILRLLFPPNPVGTHPLATMTQLVSQCCVLVLLDYRYKKRCGFDPSRGMLWAELYDLNKYRGLRPGLTPKEKDWRLIEAPPHSFAQQPVATAAAAMTAKAGKPKEAAPNGEKGAAGATNAPTAGEEAAESWAAKLKKAKEKLAAGRDRRQRSVSPARMYHEEPFEINPDLLRIREPSSGRSSPATSALNESPEASPRGNRRVRSSEVSLLSTSGAVTSLTKMSFAASEVEVRLIRSAQHPVNRPGMVAWWSTFVIGTAWQSFCGAVLGFLSFDCRSLQELHYPKIFNLTFTDRVEDAAVDIDGLFDTSVFSASLTSPTVDEPSVPAAADATAAASGHTRVASASQRDELASSASPNALPVANETSKCDVWFDWIADVGDGFNPSYEMGRLLAQPELKLKEAVMKSTRRRSRYNVASLSPGTLPPEVLATDVMRAAQVAPEERKKGLRPLAKAIVLGVWRAMNVAFSFFVGLRDDLKRTPSINLDEEDGAVDDLRVHGGAGQRAKDAKVVPASRKALDDLAAATTTPQAAPARGRTAGPDAHATPRVGAAVSGAPPTRHRRTASAGATNTHESSSPVRDARKKLHLPRASFVVIGGDLAYPSPTDETYTTRLFEPYCDALGGNFTLRKLFHARQRNIVVQDPINPDMTHIRMLDANTVSTVATGGDLLHRSRGTAEEALHSIPLLFAIPGNHDWFDGLSTFTKYIIEKSWMGGWLMPQRSSFFVLKLPHNWFMLCTDTGNQQDIDIAQRNYFLDVIEKYMDDESCVILCCHEPGWLFDAMERRGSPLQPELNRIVRELGARMRLRLAGDIHNYSRHVPIDPLSEAATLIVSGGGGAYMYGARDDKIISQGTPYYRASAYPLRNTYLTMLSHLWGFRVVNWKFDLIIGVLCFLMVFSMLPLPLDFAVMGEVATASEMMSTWAGMTAELLNYFFSHAVGSVFPFLFYWMCFSSAGADRRASMAWRAAYGFFWTMIVMLACCGCVAFLFTGLAWMGANHMLRSQSDHWGSVVEDESIVLVDMFLNASRDMWGADTRFAHMMQSAQNFFHAKVVRDLIGFVARCFDPVEALGYFAVKVSSNRIGTFAASSTRLQVLSYYACVLFFYWILVTPLVSFIIGFFVFFSVTQFDYMYDGAYSAFQIEDYKHFIRFKIDHATRELHGYVVAEKTVPKVWKLDPRHVDGYRDVAQKNLPPHLRRNPSRWGPSFASGKPPKKAEVLEHFVCRPHRTAKHA